MNLDPIELLNVLFHRGGERVPVGRLALSRGQIYFEYQADFLRGGLEISPFKLPLRSGVIACEDRVFEGLFGVFNDSLPDGWGRLLLDRAVQAKGVAFQSLTPLDRLAHVGSHAMGALEYIPDHSEATTSTGLLDLIALEQEVNKVLVGHSTEILRVLLQLGGSSAGARPKILVGYDQRSGQITHGTNELPDGYSPWLIKFPSSSDQRDIANIEYAYASMAKAAGLELPATHLFEEDDGKAYFGVKRFDRVGSQRVHMHSVAGLLHADHRYPSIDYENILRCTLALTKDMGEVSKVFRLAVFNVFAHNRDDHSKNFSFLMDTKGSWKFAPAYDLTFSYGPGREHSSLVMGEGRNPGSKQLLLLGEKFQIKNTLAIIEEVRDTIAKWNDFADLAGVSKDSKTMIEKELIKIA